MQEQKIQVWALQHQPGDTMLWKQSFWNNIIFMRDTLFPMMFNCKNDDKNDYDAMISRINSGVEIVGTHKSKSIELPVVKITYRNIVIVFRYNFYNWEMTVISDIPIKLNWDLISKNRSMFFEGFPAEYMLDTRYKQSHTKFSATILNGEYGVFTVMHAIKEQADRNFVNKQRNKKSNRNKNTA